MEVIIMFFYMFEKVGSSFFYSLEFGEQVFYEVLEKGIIVVKERRDVSMGEGFFYVKSRQLYRVSLS